MVGATRKSENTVHPNGTNRRVRAWRKNILAKRVPFAIVMFAEI